MSVGRMGKEQSTICGRCRGTINQWQNSPMSNCLALGLDCGNRCLSRRCGKCGGDQAGGNTNGHSRSAKQAPYHHAGSTDCNRADWFNIFISKLHDIVRNIAEYFETVSASANQLLVISRRMDDGIGEMNGKSGMVVNAADEMSRNMHSVASASEQAATNVGVVATSMENMNITVAEIDSSSEKSRSQKMWPRPPRELMRSMKM